MKTLKRTLSLVLAIMMVIGRVSITANAAQPTTVNEYTLYSDEASIKYNVPVGVLTGMGILGGYPDGSFQPTKTLTRAQATKLISYVLLGADAAEELTKASDIAQIYSDVPADHYAAAWIQFCTNKGIVSGVGDNRFNPDGEVTSYQLAKMILTAVGYNADAKGYKGEGWEINVAADAVSNHLFDGNLAGMNSQSVTREEAALYLYNGLFATMVTYVPVLDVHVPVRADGQATTPSTPIYATIGLVFFDYTGMFVTDMIRHVGYYEEDGKFYADALEYYNNEIDIFPVHSYDATGFVYALYCSDEGHVYYADLISHELDITGYTADEIDALYDDEVLSEDDIIPLFNFNVDQDYDYTLRTCWNRLHDEELDNKGAARLIVLDEINVAVAIKTDLYSFGTVEIQHRSANDAIVAKLDGDLLDEENDATGINWAEYVPNKGDSAAVNFNYYVDPNGNYHVAPVETFTGTVSKVLRDSSIGGYNHGTLTIGGVDYDVDLDDARGYTTSNIVDWSDLGLDDLDAGRESANIVYEFAVNPNSGEIFGIRKVVDPEEIINTLGFVIDYWVVQDVNDVFGKPVYKFYAQVIDENGDIYTGILNSIDGMVPVADQSLEDDAHTYVDPETYDQCYPIGGDSVADFALVRINNDGTIDIDFDEEHFASQGFEVIANGERGDGYSMIEDSYALGKFDDRNVYVDDDSVFSYVTGEGETAATTVYEGAHSANFADTDLYVASVKNAEGYDLADLVVIDGGYKPGVEENCAYIITGYKGWLTATSDHVYTAIDALTGEETVLYSTEPLTPDVSGNYPLAGLWTVTATTAEDGTVDYVITQHNPNNFDDLVIGGNIFVSGNAVVGPTTVINGVTYVNTHADDVVYPVAKDAVFMNLVDDDTLMDLDAGDVVTFVYNVRSSSIVAIYKVA